MNVPESEAIERAALEDIHDAADERDACELGLKGVSLGTAFLSLASRLPQSAVVINRAIGLGLGADSSSEEVHSLVSAYEDSGVSRYFVQLHPDHRPAKVSEWMQNEGLTVGRGWQKFSRTTKPVAEYRSDLSVREVGPEHGAAFAKIVSAAFDLGEPAEPWMAKIPGRKSWHVFMSFEGETPAGVGALYVKDGFGWTDFGATAPEFRQRGGQGALLAARLERALVLGCQKIFTCTGVSVPGDPQHSYSNILRAGFVEEYVRENYEPG